MSIIIFSRPIQSGKTTALQGWCDRQKNIEGILMPDINGSRKILNIKTKEVFDIECSDAKHTKEPLTRIGRFNFYTAAFEKANLILVNSLAHGPDWLIIDEIGKLELDGGGFYPAIKKIFPVYNTRECHGNLLITVRDHLVEELTGFFELKEYRIIQQLEELD